MNSTSVRQILREFFAENRPLLAGAILVLLANNFLNVLLPLSIGLFYQIVLHDEGGAKARLLAWLPLEIGSPGAFFGFFAALIALKTAFSWLERFWTGLVGERFSQNLRERTFAAQLAHTLESHRSRPVGKYLLRYSGDLTAVQNFLTKGILGFAGDAFFLLLAFAVLFSMRPLWAGAVAGLFAATAVAVAILSRFLRKKAVARRNLRSESMDFVSSRLQAFKTVKSFNRENRENRLFRRLSGRLFESAKDYLRLSALVQAVSPMFFFGTVAAVLWLVYQQVGQNPGSVRAGEVLVFVLMLLYLRGVMRRVLEANVVWQSGGASFEKLVRLLNLPAEPRGDVFKKNASPETKSSDAGEAAPAPTLRLENLALASGRLLRRFLKIWISSFRRRAFRSSGARARALF